MENTERIAFKEKLSYGMGEISIVLVRQIVSMFLIFYLTDVIGIAPAVAALIYATGKNTEALFSPVMGIVSDNWKSPKGRRRPLILYSTVPLMLSFVLMWVPLNIQSEAAQTWIYGGLTIVYFLALVSIMIPFGALGFEISEDYDERQSVVTYRIFFSMLFGLVAAVAPAAILDGFEDKAQGFFYLGVGVGIFSLVFPFITYFNVKERHSKPTRVGFKDILSSFTNKLFLQVVVIYTLLLATLNFVESYIVYYVKYVIEKPGLLEFIFLTVVGVGMASFLFWSWFSKKFGKKNAVILGCVIYILGSLGWSLWGPETATVFVLLNAAVIGVCYGFSQTIPSAMTPEVIDNDELNGEPRREGVYTAVMRLVMKLGNSALVMVAGFMLAKSGYVKDAAQNPETIVTFKWIVSGIPVVLLVIALVMTITLPLSREKALEIKRKLAEKRAREAGA